MAANRKLQAEIDRCLKKVSEGVEKFEEIWQKVHNASNTNQKEKYEEDLKKEIKKLQRLRDQIKTWIANGTMPDKTTLKEKRKLIEQQMERFKVVERETKTKAYSKEGLTSGAKLDPAEKERSEISQWLNSCLERLDLQIDQFEAEIESLGTSKKKKGRAENSEAVLACREHLDKHRDHVQKLETLLRMLDNETVNIDQIKDIKDDVEYYIENCQEPDFAENEMIYDDIDGLEEMLLDVSNNFRDKSQTSGAQDHNTNSVSETSETMSTNSASSPIPYPTSHNHSNDNDSKRRHKSSSEEAKATSIAGTGNRNSTPTTSPTSLSFPAASSAPKQLPSSTASSVTSANNNTSSTPAVLNNHHHSQISASSSTLPGHQQQQQHLSSSTSASSQARAPPSALSKLITSSSSSTPNNSSPSSGGVLINNHVNQQHHSGVSSAGNQSPASASAQQQQQPNFAAAVQVNGHLSLSELNKLGNSGSSRTSNLSPLTVSNSNSNAVASNSFASSSSASMQHQHTHPHGSTNGQEGMPSLKSMAQDALNTQQQRGDSVAAVSANMSQGLFSKGQTTPPSSLAPGAAPSSTAASAAASSTSSSAATGEAHILPLLGVAPLGPVPLNKETRFQYQMLEAAFEHMPHPSDSERLRPYLPRNPCTTPPYYPQLPPPGSDSVEFFLRLSTETLFFIFYYMEGTKAQYLAAKALKKQSWRFHTKYMMWFQRHEEPKIINDEYEQGTYIYFDFEKWGQRRKEGFTFEYRFLEDRDLS